jgi:hypothetical protein
VTGGGALLDCVQSLLEKAPMDTVKKQIDRLQAHHQTNQQNRDNLFHFALSSLSVTEPMGISVILSIAQISRNEHRILQSRLFCWTLPPDV